MADTITLDPRLAKLVPGQSVQLRRLTTYDCEFLTIREGKAVVWVKGRCSVDVTADEFIWPEPPKPIVGRYYRDRIKVLSHRIVRWDGLLVTSTSDAFPQVFNPDFWELIPLPDETE